VELSHHKQLDDVLVDEEIEIGFLHNLQIGLSIFTFSGLPLLSPLKPK